VGRRRHPRRAETAAAAGLRPHQISVSGFLHLGLRAEDHLRPRPVDPLRGRAGHRQDHVRAGHRERAEHGTVQDQHLPDRQQIHRRDREKPAGSFHRGQALQLHPVFRRVRRNFRQAQRGKGRPRPQRQRGGRLSSAADRGARRRLHHGDQPDRQHRRRVHAAHHLRRPFPVSRRRDAGGDLPAHHSAADAPVSRHRLEVPG